MDRSRYGPFMDRSQTVHGLGERKVNGGGGVRRTDSRSRSEKG